MRVPCLVAVFSALCVAVSLPSAAGQSGKWTPPRTPDGKPDLQGTFTFSTITPLQRPAGLSDKDVLTAEEAAAFEAGENKRLNRDLFDPEKGAPSVGYAPRAQGGVLSYNDFWYERGNKLTEDRRTSLIVDPPDGRIPFTAEARARMAERGAKSNTGRVDDYEELSVADRCLLGFNSGPPMISGTYNNNLQIVQTPGYVVIFTEMIHDARIIPTDGRPHGNLPRWSGDSRGAGRATRSSSRPSTSGVRPAFRARRPTRRWWNASRGSIRTRSATSSPSRTRPRTRDPGLQWNRCMRWTSTCTNTPATRGTTAWLASSAALASRRKRQPRNPERAQQTRPNISVDYR